MENRKEIHQCKGTIGYIQKENGVKVNLKLYRDEVIRKDLIYQHLKKYNHKLSRMKKKIHVPMPINLKVRLSQVEFM